MSATTRRYSVYAMTLPDESEPWRRESWLAAVPALDRLFLDKATAVRSFQNDDGKNRPSRIAGETILGGYVKFGALRWSGADHEKWTHASPSTPQASKSWRFISTDFATPSLRVFDRRGVPPHRFGRLSGARRTLAADGSVVVHPPSFFVAVAQDDDGCATLDAVMRDVACAWQATCMARRSRAWAADASSVLPLPRGLAVTRSMQDCVFAPSPAAAAQEGWEPMDLSVSSG